MKHGLCCHIASQLLSKAVLLLHLSGYFFLLVSFVILCSLFVLTWLCSHCCCFGMHLLVSIIWLSHRVDFFLLFVVLVRTYGAQSCSVLQFVVMFCPMHSLVSVDCSPSELSVHIIVYNSKAVCNIFQYLCHSIFLLLFVPF